MESQCGASNFHRRTKPFSTTMYALAILALVLAVTVCTSTEAATKSRSLNILDLFDSTSSEVLQKLPILNSRVYTVPTNSLTIFLIGLTAALTITLVAYTTAVPATPTSCSSSDYRSHTPIPLPLSSAPLEDLPALVHFAAASIPPPEKPHKMHKPTPRLDQLHKSVSCRLVWTPSVLRALPVRRSLEPPKIVRGDSDVIMTFGTDKPEVFLPMLRNSVKSKKTCTCPCGHHSPPFVSQREKIPFASNGKKSDPSGVHNAHVPPSSPCTSGRNSSTGVSIECSNSVPAVNTANNGARLVDVPHQPNPLSKMDATPQVSAGPQVNVTPYVNTMSHVNTMHQTNTSPIPVEDSPAIMIGAESLKGITIIPAGEEFDYPITEANDAITNYSHVRENSVQAYGVSEECITIPLDDVEVTGEGDRADAFDIEKGFKDPRYTMYNDEDHSVLATLVTTTTTTTTTTMTTTATATLIPMGNKEVSMASFSDLDRSRQKESAMATLAMSLVAFLLWMLESLLFGTKSLPRMITEGKDQL